MLDKAAVHGPTSIIIVTQSGRAKWDTSSVNAAVNCNPTPLLVGPMFIKPLT